MASCLRADLESSTSTGVVYPNQGNSQGKVRKPRPAAVLAERSRSTQRYSILPRARQTGSSYQPAQPLPMPEGHGGEPAPHRTRARRPAMRCWARAPRPKREASETPRPASRMTTFQPAKARQTQHGSAKVSRKQPPATSPGRENPDNSAHPPAVRSPVAPGQWRHFSKSRDSRAGGHNAISRLCLAAAAVSGGNYPGLHKARKAVQVGAPPEAIT